MSGRVFSQLPTRRISAAKHRGLHHLSSTHAPNSRSDRRLQASAPSFAIAICASPLQSCPRLVRSRRSAFGGKGTESPVHHSSFLRSALSSASAPKLRRRSSTTPAGPFFRLFSPPQLSTTNTSTMATDQKPLPFVYQFAAGKPSCLSD